MIGSRLSDPRDAMKGIPEWLDKIEADGHTSKEKIEKWRALAAKTTLHDLQEKISSTMTRLFRKPVNGGNPFLFALTAPKPHELVLELDGHTIDTAATDGRKFFWNPVFLAELTPDEVATVMQHEGYHVVFFHCKRGRGKMGQVWNIAVDYAVNGCILVDHDVTGRSGKLFGGNIGEPMSLKALLDSIDGTQELPKTQFCFADKSLHGRSPESVYDEIVDHWNKSPLKCPKCGNLSKSRGQGQGGQGQGGQGQNDGDQDGTGQCPGGCQCQEGNQGGCPSCGGSLFDQLGSLDSHIETTMSKQEVQADLMRAADQSSQMRGTLPAEIEGMLAELKKPTLKFTDIVRSAMLRKVQDAGVNNDWRRLRRRYLNTNPRQYLPRRYMHKPRWLAMLDTSGSMSDDDMAYGISQLQVLGSNTEGYVIPCDATPHWKGVHKVESADDLKRTKVVGRGGTVFDEFFRDFPKHLGTNFDVIIVLTDGDCGTVPLGLRPKGIDVVWVLTRNNKNFKPTFGRVAPLRHSRP
jgi:predicted metal-dependent peptidase